MEDENVVNEVQERIELRSRTPLFRSSVDREGSEGEYSRASNSKSRYRTNSRKSIKVTSTSESYSAPVIYNLRGINRVTSGSSESSSVDSRLKRTRRIEQHTKRHVIMNGATVVVTDDEEDEEEDEDDVTSKHQMRKSSSHKYRTSDYSSDEGMNQEILKGTAFPIYKRAGEWWNVFPKTDYTYSPVSPNRKEIIPGVIPMPNMSRRSIHAMGSYRSPSDTRNHITETSSRWFDETSFGANLESVDSDVEVDYKDVAHYSTNNRFLITRVFISIFTSIWTFFSYLWSSIVDTYHRIFHRNALLSTPPNYRETKTNNWLNHYWVMGYNTLMNAWVISHFPHREQRHSKFLLLIPPLIFVGIYVAQIYSFPSPEFISQSGDYISASVSPLCLPFSNLTIPYFPIVHWDWEFPSLPSLSWIFSYFPSIDWSFVHFPSFNWSFSQFLP